MAPISIPYIVAVLFCNLFGIGCHVTPPLPSDTSSTSNRYKNSIEIEWDASLAADTTTPRDILRSVASSARGAVGNATDTRATGTLIESIDALTSRLQSFIDSLSSGFSDLTSSLQQLTDQLREIFSGFRGP